MELATNIDVIGSLENPVIVAAVFLWGVILAVPLFLVMKKMRGRKRIALAVAVLGLGCLLSPVMNRGMSLLIYQAIAGPNETIGIIGGPSFLVSPVVALAMAAAIAGALQLRAFRASAST